VNTWKVIFATVVIFGAGAVTGGLIVHHAYRSQLNSPNGTRDTSVRPATRPGMDTKENTRVLNTSSQQMAGSRKDFLGKLDEELQLTPEQHTRIEAILGHGQERTKQIWNQIAPEVHEEWKCVKTAIRGELTEEQKQIFDRCMKPTQKKDDQRPQPPYEEVFHNASSQPAVPKVTPAQ
jgi:hypothetical protein